MQQELEHTVRTSLVHARVPVASPWWHTAVVCDLPGSYDDDDVRRLKKLLPKIAETGFQAVLLRPADPMVENSLPSLPKFVARAHDLGMRVIARVFLVDEGETLDPLDSPPLLQLGHDVEDLNERVKATLAAGCDGVDLGKIEEEESSEFGGEEQETFSESIRLQLAELASYDDAAILTTAFSLRPQHFYQRHLTEEWFHHMRNDGLISSPWNARSLQAAVAITYRTHDPVGHTAAWRHSLPGWSSSPAARDSENVGWVQTATSERRTAMNLYIASLPGAVYLPFLSTGGSMSTKVKPDKRSRLHFAFAGGRKQQFRADVTKHALALRDDLELGGSHVAFVTGFPWANDSVAIHLSGPVMVVLNTGRDPIYVPHEHRLLVSSSPGPNVEKRGTSVAPDTCAWFMTAEPKPVDPVDYR